VSAFLVGGNTIVAVFMVGDPCPSTKLTTGVGGNTIVSVFMVGDPCPPTKGVGGNTIVSASRTP
jgi:hypothetical protein